MKRIAQFEKVSRERFNKDWFGVFSSDANHIYDEIKLPKRATSGSAGYDFTNL